MWIAHMLNMYSAVPARLALLTRTTSRVIQRSLGTLSLPQGVRGQMVAFTTEYVAANHYSDD